MNRQSAGRNWSRGGRGRRLYGSKESYTAQESRPQEVPETPDKDEVPDVQERPRFFICAECGDVFNLRSAWDAHTTTVHGAKRVEDSDTEQDLHEESPRLNEETQDHGTKAVDVKASQPNLSAPYVQLPPRQKGGGRRHTETKRSEYVRAGHGELDAGHADVQSCQVVSTSQNGSGSDVKKPAGLAPTRGGKSRTMTGPGVEPRMDSRAPQVLSGDSSGASSPLTTVPAADSPSSTQKKSKRRAKLPQNEKRAEAAATIKESSEMATATPVEEDSRLSREVSTPVHGPPLRLAGPKGDLYPPRINRRITFVSCPFCPAHFYTATTLRHHILSAHPNHSPEAWSQSLPHATIAVANPHEDGANGYGAARVGGSQGPYARAPQPAPPADGIELPELGGEHSRLPAEQPTVKPADAALGNGTVPPALVDDTMEQSGGTTSTRKTASECPAAGGVQTISSGVVGAAPHKSAPSDIKSPEEGLAGIKKSPRSGRKRGSRQRGDKGPASEATATNVELLMTSQAAVAAALQPGLKSTSTSPQAAGKEGAADDPLPPSRPSPGAKQMDRDPEGAQERDFNKSGNAARPYNNGRRVHRLSPGPPNSGLKQAPPEGDGRNVTEEVQKEVSRPKEYGVKVVAAGGPDQSASGAVNGSEQPTSAEKPSDTGGYLGLQETGGGIDRRFLGEDRRRGRGTYGGVNGRASWGRGRGYGRWSHMGPGMRGLPPPNVQWVAKGSTRWSQDRELGRDPEAGTSTKPRDVVAPSRGPSAAAGADERGNYGRLMGPPGLAMREVERLDNWGQETDQHAPQELSQGGPADSMNHQGPRGTRRGPRPRSRRGGQIPRDARGHFPGPEQGPTSMARQGAGGGQAGHVAGPQSGGG